MALLKVLLILSLALPVAAGAVGEEPPVRLDAGIAKRVIAVGDTVRLNIWGSISAILPCATSPTVLP